jgi:hypothetical protein
LYSFAFVNAGNGLKILPFTLFVNDSLDFFVCERKCLSFSIVYDSMMWFKYSIDGCAYFGSEFCDPKSFTLLWHCIEQNLFLQVLENRSFIACHCCFSFIYVKSPSMLNSEFFLL